MAATNVEAELSKAHKGLDDLVDAIILERLRPARASPTLQGLIDHLSDTLTKERRVTSKLLGEEGRELYAPSAFGGSMPRDGTQNAVNDGSSSMSQLTVMKAPSLTDEQWLDQLELLKRSNEQYKAENERFADVARLMREHVVTLKADNDQLRRQNGNSGHANAAETLSMDAAKTKPVDGANEVVHLRQTIKDMLSDCTSEIKRLKQSLQAVKENQREQREQRQPTAGTKELETKPHPMMLRSGPKPQFMPPKKKTLAVATTTVPNGNTDGLTKKQRKRLAKQANSQSLLFEKTDPVVPEQAEAAAPMGGLSAHQDRAERPLRYWQASNGPAIEREMSTSSQDLQAPWHPDSCQNRAQKASNMFAYSTAMPSEQPRGVGGKRKRCDSLVVGEFF